MDAELTFRSYKPLSLEKGMWFISKTNHGTFKENINIIVLENIPYNEEEFIKINGYPVEAYIVSDNNVIATPQQIGWFDEDPDAEYMSDVTIKQLEFILNEYDGWLDIQMEGCENDDDECQPTPVVMEGKVIISYPIEYDYFDDEDDGNYYGRVCPFCGGDGIIEDASLCPECDGDGYVDNEEDPSDLDDDSDNEDFDDGDIDWQIDQLEKWNEPPPHEDM